MALSNFERMMQVVNEAFDTKNDPDQLDVDQDVREKLLTIHPATLTAKDYGDGPVAWILVIPTTKEIMTRFIAKEITEQQLYELTQPGDTYTALYLCSATVLPEYRSKGLAKQLTMDAINDIRKLHPINTLFVWPFSKEGAGLAEKIAAETGLPLLQRQ